VTLLVLWACNEQSSDEASGPGGATESASHDTTDSSTSTAEDTMPATTGEDTSEAAGEDPVDCGPGGTFETRFTVEDDECGHAPFVGFRDVMTVAITVGRRSAISVEIATDPGLEPVMGAIGDGGCMLSASGEGTVAAYPDIQVDWEGTLASDGLTGTLTLGADGALPGGCPITYGVVPE
jgi:hypothetical protein